MTNIIKAGPGIRIDTTPGWVENQEVKVLTIQLDGIISSYSSPMYSLGSPGNVLMLDKQNNPVWSDPLEILKGDIELRKNNDSLNDAWLILMDALNQYLMARKMIK